MTSLSYQVGRSFARIPFLILQMQAIERQMAAATATLEASKAIQPVRRQFSLGGVLPPLPPRLNLVVAMPEVAGSSAFPPLATVNPTPAPQQLVQQPAQQPVQLPAQQPVQQPKRAQTHQDSEVDVLMGGDSGSDGGLMMLQEVHPGAPREAPLSPMSAATKAIIDQAQADTDPVAVLSKVGGVVETAPVVLPQGHLP